MISRALYRAERLPFSFHIFHIDIQKLAFYSPYYELKKLTTLNKKPPTTAGKNPGTVIFSGKKCPIKRSTTALRINPAVPRDK